MKAEQKVQVGLWCPEQTTGAADSHEDKLAAASALIRPDGGIPPDARELSGARMRENQMEIETLNAVEEEKK